MLAPLRLNTPMILKATFLDANFLPQRRLSAEQLPLQRVADQADLGAVTDVTVSEDVAFFATPPNRGPSETRGGAVNVHGHPVPVAVNNLRPGANNGSHLAHRRTLFEDFFTILGRQRQHAAGTEAHTAAGGRSRLDEQIIAPMLAMVFSTAALEPLPISIMAITAPTPMITPKAVRADRNLFAARPQRRAERRGQERRTAPARKFDRGSTAIQGGDGRLRLRQRPRPLPGQSRHHPVRRQGTRG